MKMSGTVGTVPKGYRVKEYEEEILRFFARDRIREKRKDRGDKLRRFYFLDGPPYVTNPVHVGTAWNKIIKDAVIRFKAMRGYLVRDQPGYDMHGLPIEVVIERQLGVVSKADIKNVVGTRKFVEVCKRKALENLGLQNEQFIDLGVWMDWKKPYMTLTNEWIESVWWLIKRAHDKGLLEERKKVVHWCPRCETVLSHHEVTLEYREVEDPSIYVKFPVIGKENTYFLIWTTTPWTLPANLAVMVHPDEEYVEVRLGRDLLILAKKRISHVLEEANLECETEILRSYLGSELEGARYRFPLSVEVPKQAEFEEAHRVVLSDEYVTMDEGTGCVHSAPGHGEEDYEVGVKEGLPVFSPVDDRGRFKAEAGKYAGLGVFEANRVVIEDLKGKGLLLYSGSTTHKYPFCWRCKTKLVLRSTPQWFIPVTRIRDRLIEENERIQWVPEWAGKARFKKWLEGARDWVISRQRYWGTPLPIWACESCGRRVVIGSIKELKERAASLPDHFELHKPWVDEIKLKCECGGRMDRVPDLTDVWMDSGVASWACLGFPGREDELKAWWPSDFITEGPDQTRGWFYTLLISGVVGFDQAPYKRVLMHGWTLDERGIAMHKSLGNIILPREVIDKYGRDALRLYVLQNTMWDDMRFSWKGVKGCMGSLQTLWNLFYFATLYMNLDRFDPKRHSLESLWPDLRFEDRWIISKVEGLKRSVTQNMESLLIHVAVSDLVDFVLNDLSRWYIRLIRRRFWEEKTSKSKLAAYASLYHVLKNVLILSSPFIPFIVEKLYQSSQRAVENVESIHLMPWPNVVEKWVNSELESDMDAVRAMISAVLGLRQRMGIKLRQPIANVIFVSDDSKIADTVNRCRDILLSQANARQIDLIGIQEERKLKRTVIVPNLAKLGPLFKGETPRVVDALSKVEGGVIKSSFERKGSFELRFNDEAVTILPDHVSLHEEAPEGLVEGEFDGGRVYIDFRLTKELLAEGLARDLVRRMQSMRKMLDLRVEEFVDVYVLMPKGDTELLKGFVDYIKQEVRIRRLATLGGFTPPWEPDLEREWSIKDEKFVIGMKKTTHYRLDKAKRWDVFI